LIRHANPSPATPVLALSIPVIQPAFRAPLVTAVCATPLLQPGFVTAGGTTVTLPAITVRTDPEHRLATAATANPLPENNFAMNLHASPQTGLDNGSRSWQVRTSFDAW
jgi:hypothetical protein